MRYKIVFLVLLSFLGCESSTTTVDTPQVDAGIVDSGSDDMNAVCLYENEICLPEPEAMLATTGVCTKTLVCSTCGNGVDVGDIIVNGTTFCVICEPNQNPDYAYPVKKDCPK